MIIGIGTDIIEIERVQKAIERQGNKFLEEVFTKNERDYCEKFKKTRFAHYAGRFAAKEAIVKASGIGMRDGIIWHDIEILNDSHGKPYVILTGTLKEKIDPQAHFLISISHNKSNATATALLQM